MKPRPIEVLERELVTLKDELAHKENELKYAQTKLEMAKIRVVDTEFAINQLNVIFTSAASHGRKDAPF